MCRKYTELYDELKKFYEPRNKETDDEYEYNKEFLFNSNSSTFREMIGNAIAEIEKSKEGYKNVSNEEKELIECYNEYKKDKNNKGKNKDNKTREKENKYKELCERVCKEIIVEINQEPDETYKNIENNLQYYGSIEKILLALFPQKKQELKSIID